MIRSFLSHRDKKNSRTQCEGFTLVEVLIAATIFTIVSLIAITVFVNVIRIQRRVQLENAIYEDARVMMERIAREIRQNTVDYEEYYNKAMAQDVGFVSLPGLNNTNPYGNRYGCYAQRFYNPGSDNAFGAQCSDGNTPATEPGCIIDKTSLDINTGQNPYAGTGQANTDVSDANAFCDLNFAGSVDPSCGQPGDVDHSLQSELYLINASGTGKTILARKTITADGENSLALLKLTGQDQDQDGVDEVWRDCDTSLPPNNQFCCAQGFDCSALDLTTDSLENTLSYNASNNYIGFVPISPSRTDITSLKFYVDPLEDPRKAFAETDPTQGIQQQPHVTVVLTVQPSKASLSGFNGDVPTVTLQTTVTSRVYNEVKSYYPNDNLCAAY